MHFELPTVNSIRRANIEILQAGTSERSADGAFGLRTRDHSAESACPIKHLDAQSAGHIKTPV